MGGDPNLSATHKVPNIMKAGGVMRPLGQFWRGLSSIPRGLLTQLLGTAGGTRDPYTSFGWDRTISDQAAWEMYLRGGIAKRIVHAYPDAVWGNPPEITGTKTWDKAWEEFQEKVNIWQILHRLDRLTNLGRYAVLLVGNGDYNLQAPMKAGSGKLLFLQPYSSRAAVITKWGTDPGNERFGLPTEYTIYPNRAAQDDVQLGGQTRQVANMPSFQVHWSRIIHVAQGQLENDIYGIPNLWAVWNYLTDLQKVVGGSAESYWLTANRGIHADVDKEMEMAAEDEAGLSEEIEEYHNGMRRFIRTRGVRVTSLGSEVANPEGPFKTLVTLIAGTTKIPQRVLVGSEAAHNASTQDKGNWAEAVGEYRVLTAEPGILIPVLNALMTIGVLPTLKQSKLKKEWPDAYHLSPLEEGQLANQRASAANNISLALKNTPNLFSVEEGRELICMEPELPKDGTKPEMAQVPAAPGKAGDGGVTQPGPGSGTTATTGSDTNGKGAPVPGRKATNV